MISKRQCERALTQYAERLERYEGVVGMGIVRLDKESERSRESTDAVAVYVRRKLPKKELSPNEIIPRFLELMGRGKARKTIELIEAAREKSSTRSSRLVSGRSAIAC